MGKKKKHRKPRPAYEIATAPPPVVQKVEPSKKSSNLVFVLAFVLIVVLTIAYFWRSGSDFVVQPEQAKDTNAILAALSQIDFRSMEPQVAEKIRKLKDDAAKNPQSAAAWGKLAMNLDVHDLRLESIDCYRQAAALDPKDFRWPYLCAIALSNLGSPDAIEMFEKAKGLRADYAPLLVRYGESLFNLSRLDDAAQEFQEVLGRDLRSSHAHVGLARVALSRNDLEECKTQVSQALEIDPGHGEAHGLLAELYRRMNKKDEAEKEAQIAQQLPKEKPLADPVYVELENEGISSTWYETRGRAYLEQGNYNKAIEELQSSLRAKPDARAYDTLGVLYQKLGKYADAIRYHQEAVKLNPKSAVFLNNLASAYYGMDRMTDAIAATEQAKDTDPLFAISYINLAIFYTRSEKQELAIQSLREGRKVLPENMGIASRLAWILATSSNASARNGKEAVHLAKMICDRTKNQDPQALDVLAAAYAETGNFPSALETAMLAQQISMKQGRTGLANQIATHIQLFKSNTPYHEK